MSAVWALRMAWRESRGNRRRLLVFLFSMVVGVALLVALSSTSDSLQYSVDQQARELLGADIRFLNSIRTENAHWGFCLGGGGQIFDLIWGKPDKV